MRLKNDEVKKRNVLLHYLANSTGSLLALSVFVPAFFLLVQNSHMFPIEYFAYAVLTVAAISMGFFAAGICWDNGVRHLPFSTIALNVKSLFLILIGGICVFCVIYYPDLSINKFTNQNSICCFICFVLGVFFYGGAQRTAPCLKFSCLLIAVFLSLYLISNVYLLESDWANDRNADYLFGMARLFLITMACCSTFVCGVFCNIGIQRIPLLGRSSSISMPMPTNHLSSILVGICSALLIFYFSLPTKMWFDNKTVLYIFYATVVVIFGLVSLKFTRKPLVLFLTIFLGISLIRLPLNIYSEYSTASKMPYNKFMGQKINNTPNIYLFYLESYVDLESMEQIFGIDNSKLKAKLSEHNYITYENAHSNAPYTLASLYTCFTAQPEYLDIHRGFADVILPVRSMIGGSEDNMLFSFFKDNGYKTISYYDSPSYYYYGRGPLLDESSFPEKDYSFDMKAGLTLDKASPFIVSILKKMSPSQGVGKAPKFSMEPNRIIEKVQEVVESKQPTFFLFKKGAFHSPNGHHWSDGAKWVESNLYQGNIAKSNKEVFAILDGIAEHDPNAMVILMGDHGPMRLLKIDQGCVNVDELNKKLVDNGFTMKELIQDRFGIFLAIKMPDYAEQDISFGHALITPANLFRHIFAALDHNPLFLEDRTEDAFYLDYSGLKLTMERVEETH